MFHRLAPSVKVVEFSGKVTSCGNSSAAQALNKWLEEKKGAMILNILMSSAGSETPSMMVTYSVFYTENIGLSL
jgi:hypothetical protein